MVYSILLDWKNFNIDLPSIEAWVKTQSDNYVGASADSRLTLWFSQQPSAELETTVRNKWATIHEESPEATAHNQAAQLRAIKAQVAKVTAFSADLLAQFAAENIQMGITADGKTEDVMDTMMGVMQALQAGSPTIAIKRAKAIPESEYDSKYVTEVRLLKYVNAIEKFLGLPVSSSL